MGVLGRRILVALILLLVGTTLAACGSREGFGEELVRYPARKTKLVELADGGRLAVGSRTGHDVTVQWRDPGGDGWTAPETVYREAQMWTHDISTRKAWNTVAITPDFWAERTLDDDYAPDHTALVVCRDYRCEKPVRSPELSSAQLDAKGDFVAFGLAGRRMSLWLHGRGFREVEPSGVPEQAEIRILPDGAFLAAAGVWDGQLCRYRLFTSAVHEVDFEPAATTPGYPDRKPCRFAGLEVQDQNHAAVFVESIEGNVAFVREEGTWTADLPEVPRMVFADTQGRSTIAPQSGRVEPGVEVVIGSPDTKSIYAQSRPEGEESWSRRQLVARAPEGMSCRFANLSDGGGAAMVVVSCYDDARPWRNDGFRRAEQGLVLATSDGTSWRVAELRAPAFEPVFTGEVNLANGADLSLLFGKGYDDFVTVRLPMDPARDSMALTEDGRHVLRMVGNDDPKRTCRPAYTYASIEATAWPAPTPIEGVDAGLMKGPGTCSTGIYRDGAGYTVSFNHMDYGWEGYLVARVDGFRLRPPG